MPFGILYRGIFFSTSTVYESDLCDVQANGSIYVLFLKFKIYESGLQNRV